MYLTISGGAYGMEEAVRAAGARITLALCLIVPLALSLPSALMAAELTSLMPEEGGFYLWVKAAMGPFAGFAEAFFTTLYATVDMALYPVLFAAYLGYLVPTTPATQVAIGIALVWLAGGLNLMGVRPVGNTSIVLTAALLAPFAALVIIGIPQLVHWQMPAYSPLAGGSIPAALAGGLTVAIWNYCGWENLSMVAGEIEAPRRNYIRAIWIVLPMVTLSYLLPLGVALSGARDTSQWHVGYFAVVARSLGGPWLGAALAIGGAISAFALFTAGMLWVSRMPFVLARERYLPERLAMLSQSTDTPRASIVLCCVVFTMLVPLGFTALVVVDVFFYMAGLALEMAALVRLRKLRPNRAGLFKIPGGAAMLALVVAAPLAVWILTFGFALGHGDSKADFVVAILLMFLVAPAYLICRWRYGGPPA